MSTHKAAIISLVFLVSVGPCPGYQQSSTAEPADSEQPLTARERMLLERIADLEQRVDALEKKSAVDPVAPLRAYRIEPEESRPHSNI
jgi:hypothetical protein